MTTPAPSPFVVDEYSTSKVVGYLTKAYHHEGKEISDDDWWMSIVYLLFAGVGLPVLSVVVMYLWACFAGCKCCRTGCLRCCFCMSKKCSKRCIVLFFILGSVVIAALYPINGRLQNAASDMADKSDNMAELFYNIEHQCHELHHTDLLTSITAAKADQMCSAMHPGDAALIAGANGIEVASIALVDMSKDLAEVMDYVTIQIDKVIKPNIQNGIYAIAGLFLILTIIGIGAVCTNCWCDDMIMMLLGGITLIVTGVLIGVLMASTVAIADFCSEDPGIAITTFANQTMDDPSLIEFYMTCEGTSPITTQLGEIYGEVETMSSLTSNAGDGCAPATTLESQFTKLETPFMEITKLAACDKVNPNLHGVFTEDLCGGLLTNVTYVWVDVALASLILWIALCMIPCGLHSAADDDSKSGNGKARSKASV